MNKRSKYLAVLNYCGFWVDFDGSEGEYFLQFVKLRAEPAPVSRQRHSIQTRIKDTRVLSSVIVQAGAQTFSRTELQPRPEPYKCWVNLGY